MYIVLGGGGLMVVIRDYDSSAQLNGLKTATRRLSLILRDDRYSLKEIKYKHTKLNLVAITFSYLHVTLNEELK